MTSKRALITGINGQDGAYLASLLLELDYQVIGTCRSTHTDFWRLNTLGISDHPNLQLQELNLADLSSIQRVMDFARPDEIYNLAAISTLAEAHGDPLKTALVNGLAPVSILDAIQRTGTSIRFFQASSAEIFGSHRKLPQTEKTALAPSGPYAIAKAHAHQMVEYYREQHGVFACNCVLYNHESPLRGEKFVSRKITSGLAAVATGKQAFLEIGNLNARRDWGFAGDYVEAMRLMLAAEKPDSYILCTGHMETVRNFISLACQAIDINIRWQGQDLNEVGINPGNGAIIVKVNAKYYRPETDIVATGIPAKAEIELGWKVTTGLEGLCKLMMSADLEHQSR